MSPVSSARASMLKHARIVSTGMALPSRVVTNHDLEKLMDTSDEWIRQRSGISERRYIEDNRTPSDLAYDASMQALESANLKPKDIDLIIVATLTPEHYFPGTSAFLQRKLGLTTTPALDIRCQCSGFVYGLSVANSMLQAGTYRRILLCGVEAHSRALEMSTRGRDVSVLFGDGAACVIMESHDDANSSSILDVELHAQGEHAEKLWMPYPSMAETPAMSERHIREGLFLPQMDGRFVFKHAVERMCEVVGSVLTKAGISPDEVSMFLFHQANLRINDAVLQMLKQPPEKTYNNIMKYGNCSAASIPLCLHEVLQQNKIKRGDLICMSAFGSGFAWGAALIRW